MVAIDRNALFTPLGAMPSAMLVLPPALVGNVVFDESVVALLIPEGKIAAIQAPLRLEMIFQAAAGTIIGFGFLVLAGLGIWLVRHNPKLPPAAYNRRIFVNKVLAVFILTVAALIGLAIIQGLQ